jgi:cytoskeletal protein RodZ
MGSFGEDLRTQRLARGVSLEEITAVTKISQRHLLALEQERFRLLPGGILSKGIVRGYVNALGLDEHAWTERFLQACDAAGQKPEDERGWTAFAANVGKARIMRHDAAELRLRWVGALILAIVVLVAGFFLLRLYGERVGWWSTLLPTHVLASAFHAVKAKFAHAPASAAH